MPRPFFIMSSRNYVNVIVAGKRPAPQWLSMDEAIRDYSP
jgi:xylulose-5-phosphate/fructose-6-phosphate phosphoketolase